MDGVAVAVPGALAGVLAQWTPAVGVASALTSDGVTVAVWVTRTHLATVWSPELKRTAWWPTNKPRECILTQILYKTTHL